MNEREFVTDYAPLLAALRRHRGVCPEADELIDVAPDEMSAAARDALERHLALCPTCAAIAAPEADEIDDLAWERSKRRLDRAPKPWLAAGRARGDAAPNRRPWMALAASILVLAGAALVWQRLGGAPAVEEERRVSTTRGATIQALEPVGAASTLESFRWSTALPVDLAYRVVVTRDGEPIWSAETVAYSLAAPGELTTRLESGVVYHWRVVGLDEQRILAKSDWTAFEIRP